jgi:hypothetical protein
MLGLATAAQSAALLLPVDPFAVSSLFSPGGSFGLTGTLTGTDTFEVTVSGTPCLQSGGTFCTNAAGVVVIAGTTGVGGSLANGGTTFGSLLMTISGVGTAQLFATNAGNGLGSGSPPTVLSLPATALSTFFGAFSVTNPTISFEVSDTGRGDNSGSFSLTQDQNPIPEPGTVFLPVAGLAALALTRRTATRR